MENGKASCRAILLPVQAGKLLENQRIVGFLDLLPY